MSKKEKKKAAKKAPAKPVILLNFDGTVMDTEPAILATYRHMFAKYGQDTRLTKEIAMDLLDTRVDAMLKKYFPDNNTDELLDEYRSYQNNHLRDLIQPMKGSVDFLRWLKDEGYKVGIVSTRDRSSVVDLLEHTDMAQFIDVILGNAGSGTDKMSSDSIILACVIMKAEYCVFIADGPSDIQAGHEAGVLSIGYVSNRDKTPLLLDAHPDFVTADFREIRKLIDTEPLWLAYPLSLKKKPDDEEE